MKEFLGIVGALVLAVALLAGLSIGSYHLYAYLAPKYEATNRDVMIQSRSYTEGTIRELYTIKRQYLAAQTDAERATLADAARHEFSIFPADRLPPDLRDFMAMVGG